jgi:hypothetical protein
MRPDVTLAPSDDRLCRECYEENERQLQEIRKQAAGEVPTSGKGRPARGNDKKSAKKPASKATTPDTAVGVVNVATDTVDNCDGAGLAVASRSAVIPCVDELSALRQLVQTQQEVINKLQSQLEFVLSYLDIKHTDKSAPGDAGGQPDQSSNKLQSTTVNNETSEDHCLWSEVVSRTTKRPDTFQQSAVTAVYVDQTIKKRHESSLIISGMQPAGTQSDASTFAALCNDEFQLQPCIAYTKRLGRPETGRIQPLLVVLKQRDQAQQLISSAKLLRRSANVAVRSSVFINPYMTRAEAAAAYQMRVQRRLSRQQRAHQNVSASVSGAIDDDLRQNERPHGNVSSATLPNGVPPARQEVIDRTGSALNPQADSFSPTVFSAAVSD